MTNTAKNFRSIPGTQPVTLSFTDGELALVLQAAFEQGLSLTEFFRAASQELVDQSPALRYAQG